MLVKIYLTLTKSVTTGDTDEVRVQSEEPNLRSLLSSGLFAFPLSHGSRTAFFNTPKCVLQRRLLQAIAEKKLPGTLISIHYTDKRG